MLSLAVGERGKSDGRASVGFLSSFCGSHLAGVQGRPGAGGAEKQGCCGGSDAGLGSGVQAETRIDPGEEGQAGAEGEGGPHLLQIKAVRRGGSLGTRGARRGLPGSPPPKGRPLPRSGTAWWGPGAC